MGTFMLCIAVAAVSAFAGGFVMAAKKNTVIDKLNADYRKMTQRAISAEVKNDLQNSPLPKNVTGTKSKKKAVSTKPSANRRTSRGKSVASSSSSSVDAGFMGWMAGLVSSDDSSNSSRNHSHSSSSDYSPSDYGSSYSSDSGSSSYDSGSY